MTYKRTDSNQTKIVADLRKLGFSVAIISSVGKGLPDIICGAHGINFLFEIKDGDKPLSSQKLTKDEKEWHAKWKGQVTVINSFEEAVYCIRQKIALDYAKNFFT